MLSPVVALIATRWLRETQAINDKPTGLGCTPGADPYKPEGSHFSPPGFPMLICIA